MSTAEPVTISEDERRRARSAGRHAALADLGASTCPYPAAGTPRERILARVWLLEYNQYADTVPVSYEG